MQHMIFKGKIKQFPCIIYQSKKECDETIAGLVKINTQMYAGLTSEPYVKQIG
jgi:hypothetical protein